MITEWTIQGRTHQCSATGRPFEEGELFYALLFEERDGYRREDWSEEAYRARPPEAEAPYSFWRAKYEPPPPVVEALPKQTAEDLLRRYMEESTPQHGHARYLLAVMLERKRLLREIEVKPAGDGRLNRIYEHVKTGEVFVIPDPQLHLDQLAQVQAEIAPLLQ